MPCPSEMVPGVSAIQRPTIGITGACTAARRADWEKVISRVTEKSMESFLCCRPVEHAAWPRRGHRALLEDDLAIDDHGADPGGVAVRLLERRGVGDAGGVEHRNVGLHALLEHAAVGKAEALRRKRRHLLYRGLERQQLQLADVAPEHPHERAVAARVRHVAAED